MIIGPRCRGRAWDGGAGVRMKADTATADPQAGHFTRRPATVSGARPVMPQDGHVILSIVTGRRLSS